jgi:rare lipoprotein A
VSGFSRAHHLVRLKADTTYLLKADTTYSPEGGHYVLRSGRIGTQVDDQCDMRGIRVEVVCVATLIAVATSCARGSAPSKSPSEVAEGLASYYANSLDGQLTASGARFDNDSLVAAHPTYPFGTRVRVTNVGNGRSVTVRIVDRGPARAVRDDGVIIDVSRAAAAELGFLDAGRTRVRLEVVGGEPDGPRASGGIDEAPEHRLDRLTLA